MGQLVASYPGPMWQLKGTPHQYRPATPGLSQLCPQPLGTGAGYLWVCQVCPTHLYAETQHKILYCQRGFMDRSTPSPVLTPLKDPSDSALLRVPHHYRWFTEASCGPCYCSEMSIPRTRLCLQKVGVWWRAFSEKGSRTQHLLSANTSANLN